MPDRLPVQHRVLVLAELERISFTLADISTWLSHNDADAAAVMLEDAARNVAAAGWVLETPIRPRIPGAIAGGMQSGGQPDPG
jgi:hypothetical protein